MTLEQIMERRRELWDIMTATETPPDERARARREFESLVARTLAMRR